MEGFTVTVLNRIGFTLMIVGLLMGAYYAFEWYKGKSSAQDLTTEEIKNFEQQTSKQHSTKYQ